MTDAFASQPVPFLDIAANTVALAEKIIEQRETALHGIWELSMPA